MKKNLGKKLALLFMAISIIPLSIVGWMAYRKSAETISDIQLEKLNTLAEKQMERINALVRERRRDVELLAGFYQFPDIVEAFATTPYSDETNVTAYLELDLEHSTYLTAYAEALQLHDILIIAPDGQVVYSIAKESDLGTNLLTGPYKETELARVFRIIKEQYKVGQLNIAEYPPSDELAVFIAGPVMKGQALAGVLAFQLSSHDVYGLASDQSGLGKNGQMILAIRDNDEARIINPSRTQSHMDFAQRLPLDAYDPSPIQQAASRNNGSGAVKDHRGVPVLAAWRYIPALNLGMVLQIDQREAYAPNRALAIGFGLIGLFTIVIVIALSLPLAHSISNPLGDIIRGTISVASGETDTRIDISSGSEIGMLAEAFNEMAEQLDKEHKKTEQQHWIRSKISGLDDVMRGGKSVDALCMDVITYIASSLQLPVGVLALVDRKKERLRIVGRYACSIRKQDAEFAFGEGLIGQAAQQQTRMILQHVPEHFMSVTSALGETVPASIACFPLIREGETVGVIEIGNLNPFTELQLEYLDHCMERIAIAIHTARTYEQINILLQQSQAQAEELQSQQEELRVANEELMEKNETLARRQNGDKS